MTAPHSIQPEYDLVFAGGGSAGCITAGRLAAAFPNLSILVLESGPATKNNKEHMQPGHLIAHVLPNAKTMQHVISQPSEHVAGRRVDVSTGHCVGGGSSVNWLYYNRPSASDLDDWVNEYGNDGWSSKELIPLLIKVLSPLRVLSPKLILLKAETYEAAPNKPTHGYDGPLKISFGGHKLLEVSKQFLDVGVQMEKSRLVSDEINDFTANSLNRFANVPKWISSNGRRSDTAHHYVYNKNLSNLSVMDGCLVNRVVVENGVAIGVEYVFDKRIYESSPQDVRLVKARKLVVVAAGAMNSPLILERSGIGRKEILERAGIPVVAEVPGVGHDYQDHTVCLMPYIVDPSYETMNKLWRKDPATWETAMEQWDKDGSGLFGTSGLEVAVKLRPTADELADLGPDFLPVWNESFRDRPDKPIIWLSMIVGLPADQSALPPLDFIVPFNSLNYPRSRGHLHIASADPYAEPDFQSGFLSHPADVAAHRWAYKKGHEITRRMPSFRGALGPAHPTYSEGSAAAAQMAAQAPTPIDAPKLTYTAADDEAIDAWLRNTIWSTLHSLGTCAMKPFDKGGVVDPKLNVYGVKNLKVADVSIPPSNVHSNTYSLAVLIGEKAAVIIAKELGGSI
ncbi:GMC oxidoreductase-domain-containing protein [Mycena metata]|uniref:GMC oxidoreductase-domain-containing protein n=1 Tax=Mycena metata TaxID=1033252 RepID=A0AAD7JV35_9AGAR|nr:GMC oxidoreductase-domain-containing protein [Mycena metata]